jgi:osmotically-inducible protein OsmY
MKSTLIVMVSLLLCCGICVSAEVTTFHAYVDSDVCARLMLGPITDQRTECSQKTYKEGADPLLVRLSDNTVFDVNKQKMLKDNVGKLAEVSGEAKLESGTMKLQSVKPEEMSSIPAGDPARLLLDVRSYQAKRSASTYEQVRHELAMMPYITTYDFISYTMVGSNVILTGWTVRQTNRNDAYNRVKSVEGVDKIINNIEILPMGRSDMEIRAGVRARLQRNLSRYFWGSGSDIKIVVKNGKVILLGTVSAKADSDIANVQSNTVPGVFHVFNLLKVKETVDKGKI